MLPGLIVATFGMIALLVYVIFIPILGTVYRENLLSFLNDLMESLDADIQIDDSMLKTFLIVLWIFMAVSAGTFILIVNL